MILHVMPINDLKQHKESSTCECNPKLEELANGDIMFTHNSYDGREFIERLVETKNISLN